MKGFAGNCESWRPNGGGSGHCCLGLMLERQGIKLNRKKLYRLYKEERLMVRKRGGRKRALGTRAPMAVPQDRNLRWSLDFVADTLVERTALPHPHAGR